jgi:uncharacterized protein (TIGR03067 family)
MSFNPRGDANTDPLPPVSTQLLESQAGYGGSKLFAVKSQSFWKQDALKPLQGARYTRPEVPMAPSGLPALFALIVTLSAGSGVVAVQTAPETGKAKTSKTTELEGVWIVQSMERNGQPRPLPNEGTIIKSGANPGPMPKDMRITFQDGQAILKGFVTTSTGNDLRYAYTVDAAAKPKTLTLKQDADVIATVYELTDETLRLVLTRPGVERPSKVSSEGNTLYVLKKTK